MKNSRIGGPSSSSVGGGLTMYERSMIQKEERERKMKALEEKLMSDWTFTPSKQRTRAHHGSSPPSGGRPGIMPSSSHSVSTLGTDTAHNNATLSAEREAAFARLYSTETASFRAQCQVAQEQRRRQEQQKRSSTSWRLPSS